LLATGDTSIFTQPSNNIIIKVNTNQLHGHTETFSVTADYQENDCEWDTYVECGLIQCWDSICCDCSCCDAVSETSDLFTMMWVDCTGTITNVIGFEDIYALPGSSETKYASEWSYQASS
jgi:hypothetical protein